MENSRKRKTDRRTLYTCNAIKDALLELLAVMDYSEITVASLCRRAEIGRGTFYLHYNNIMQVIDALLDDALGMTHSMLFQIGCESAGDEKCAYPLCRFLREQSKYQQLFFSDSLRGKIIERMTAAHREQFISSLKERTGLDDSTLSAIFLFQLSGCLAVTKANLGIEDSSWTDIQCSIDGFLKDGITSISK